MHVGWTQEHWHPAFGVFSAFDADVDGPRSVHGDLMDYEEVQLAADGELFIKSPYLTYDPNDTKVVRYMLFHSEEYRPPFSKVGWRAAPNASEARRQVRRDFGTILEENAAGDNVFFRVYKERQ